MSKSRAHVVSNLGPRPQLLRPRALAIAGVVAIVLLLSVFAVHYARRNQKTESVQKAMKTAESAYATGDYQTAYRELKAAEKQATGDDEKFNLYNNLAAAASTTGNVGEAIHYYNLKHEVRPDTIGADAYLMATLYERSGEKEKALEQYRIALDYEKKVNNKARIESLEARIQNLEVQP